MVTKTSVAEYVEDTVRRLKGSTDFSDATVLLIGSAARGTQNWRSDTDILIITPKPIQRWRTPIQLHLRFETRDRFLERLRQGDDYPAWAIRYGKVLADESGWWNGLLSSTVCQRWPDWRTKIGLAKRRLRMATDLLEAGDPAAGEEELLSAVSHIARAFLLRSDVFPLSRAEMPAQLREIGEANVSKIMERLITGNLRSPGIRWAAAELGKCIHLLEAELRGLSFGRED